MSHKARISVSLITAAFLGAIVFAVVDKLRDPWFSSPTRERFWAPKVFDHRFSPTAVPVPLLKSYPAPSPSIETRGKNLVLEIDVPGALDRPNNPRQLFQGGDEHIASLPDGGKLTLEAIALAMPHDAEWTDAHAPKAPLTFLDPATLEPLPNERMKKWPRTENIRLRGDGSRLLMVLSHRETSVFQWHFAQSFDDRTLAPASVTNSYRTSPGFVLFDLDLGIWHQTPLRIAIDFAFSGPEVQSLELKESSEIVFGDEAAMVRVLRRFPQKLEWRRGSIRGNENGNTTHSIEVAPESPQNSTGREQGLIIFMWPPCNDQLISFRHPDPSGEMQEQLVYGSGGIVTLQLRGHAASLESIEARRLSQLGRAIFLLPKIPRLPDVKNLFDAPIPCIRFRDPTQMPRAIEFGAGVNWLAYKNQPPMDHFPLTMTATTPRGLMKKHCRLTGRPLYFDRKKFFLNSDPPPSLKDRLIEWIKDALP